MGYGPSLRLRAKKLTLAPLLLWAAMALSIGLGHTLAATFTWAAGDSKSQADSLPSGYESYDSRPDILKLQAKAHSGLGSDWSNLKRGHLEAVAMLLEMYPTQEIYFLARDSEILYDFARWVARDDAALSKRIHLLNISRANMRAEHVQDYLAQEGITSETLKSGKQVLFVDTGFSGTIPRVISEYYPAELRSQLKTHLMSSSNPAHPSTRVFLTAINPAAPDLHPGSMHGSIVSYEHMPRYTDRSDRFARINGRWQPLSKTQGASDGSVSREKAQAAMEDLLAYANQKEAQTLLNERRAQWKKIRNIAMGEQDKASNLLTQELKSLLDAHPKDLFIEAMVRDTVEILASNHGGQGVNVSVEALGLKPILSGSHSQSNKNALITKYPEWAPILENPETEIKKLIQLEDFGKLGAIVDAIHDTEFITLLCKTLGSQSPTPGAKNLVKVLIEKGDNVARENLITYVFSTPHSVKMKEELSLLIEKGDSNIWQRLALDVFPKPYVADLKDQLRLLIEKSDKDCFGYLAQRLFNNPFPAEIKDELKLMIEKGNYTAHLFLLSNVFSQPHTSEMKDLLRLLIENIDPSSLQLIKIKVLTKPHWANHPELPTWKEACDILDPSKRREFLETKLGLMDLAHPISIELKEGAFVETMSGKKLRVEKSIDSGKRGKVFQVKDTQGKLYALKVARNSEPETLKSLTEESTKTALYEKHQIPHAKIHEHQSTYALKDWIEGVRADAWMKDWAEKGSPADATQVKALQKLIGNASQKGVYIGDLNAKNLIWDEHAHQWVVVDSGSILEGLSVDEALDRYAEKVPHRWAKAAPKSAESCLRQALQSLKLNAPK